MPKPGKQCHASGYDRDYAFKLQNIPVGEAPASLSGPVVVISEVNIVSAKLIAEQKGLRTRNQGFYITLFVLWARLCDQLV